MQAENAFALILHQPCRQDAIQAARKQGNCIKGIDSVHRGVCTELVVERQEASFIWPLGAWGASLDNGFPAACPLLYFMFAETATEGGQGHFFAGRQRPFLDKEAGPRRGPVLSLVGKGSHRIEQK